VCLLCLPISPRLQHACWRTPSFAGALDVVHDFVPRFSTMALADARADVVRALQWSHDDKPGRHFPEAAPPPTPSRGPTDTRMRKAGSSSGFGVTTPLAHVRPRPAGCNGIAFDLPDRHFFPWSTDGEDAARESNKLKQMLG